MPFHSLTVFSKTQTLTAGIFPRDHVMEACRAEYLQLCCAADREDFAEQYMLHAKDDQYPLNFLLLPKILQKQQQCLETWHRGAHISAHIAWILEPCPDWLSTASCMPMLFTHTCQNSCIPPYFTMVVLGAACRI